MRHHDIDALVVDAAAAARAYLHIDQLGVLWLLGQPLIHDARQILDVRLRGLVSLRDVVYALKEGNAKILQFGHLLILYLYR